MSTAQMHAPGRHTERTTVRVDGETRRALRELARELHLPMQAVVARAVELYRRQVMVEEANAAYAALRANPERWAELAEERALYEGALLDGIQDDPYPV